MLHWETGGFMTTVIVIKVLVKERRKEGMRNCFLHLPGTGHRYGILDDSLYKLVYR
jgi:hypothetical protein